jgi:hypothetical protein
VDVVVVWQFCEVQRDGSASISTGQRGASLVNV